MNEKEREQELFNRMERRAAMIKRFLRNFMPPND